MKGSKCPTCSEFQFHNTNGLSVCSYCYSIGWSLQDGFKKVGKGRGKLCVACSNHTLHIFGRLPTGQNIRRCTTCLYCLIEAIDNQ